MRIEIEAKLKVDSFDSVKKSLKKLSALFEAEQRQTDFYFDDLNSAFSKSDSCLRLRQQKDKRVEKFFLTYKGPKQKSNFKKRAEIEIEVNDFEAAEKFLSALGYKKAIVVEKKRQLWRLGACIVSLDTVLDLGSFVEIEGPDDKRITEVQKQLGLEELGHIKSSYADLLAEKLRSQTER
jgi:adenylate cyclase class 2